jgi:chloride channel protein, CIC family
MHQDGTKRRTESHTSNEPGALSEAQALAESAGATQTEMRLFLRSEARRRFLVPRAVLVGFVVGAFAVAFRIALERVNGVRDGVFSWAHGYGFWGLLLCMAWSAAFAGLGVFLVRRFAPETSGSGIPHLKGVLHHLRVMRPWRILIVKFGAGVIALGSGLVVGREGPTLQMGGALGQLLGRRLGAKGREREVFIAAGAGAGLAAAFNAPLAGLLFVLEELQGNFAPGMFAAALVASIVADVVGRTLTGQLPAFHVTLADAPSLSSLPVYLVLGVLAGLAGVAFNRALLGGLNFYARLSRWPVGTPAALMGALLGAVGFYAPDLLGGGHHLVEQSLAARVALGALPLLFLARFALTVGSYGTGAPGGFFAPLLVLGAQLGLMVGLLTQDFAPQLAAHPQNFAVVGMAALFASAVRAPLTGIVLIIEMTNGYSLILPLLAACMCAYGIADWLGDAPIYEALLQRELLRGQETGRLEGAQVLEIPLQAGALLDGQRAGNLDLPEGCVLVSLSRQGNRIPVMLNTVLQAGDALSFVVSPHATGYVAQLRQVAQTPMREGVAQ